MDNPVIAQVVAIPKRKWTRRIKQCTECDGKFQSGKELNAHIETENHIQTVVPKRQYNRKIKHDDPVPTPEEIPLKRKYEHKIHCTTCGTQFKRKNTLIDHMKKVHNQTPLPKHPQKFHECGVCFAIFRTAKNLKTHREEEGHERTNRKKNILCTECDIDPFTYLYKLRDHLKTVHNIENKLTTKKFKSRQDFEEWKNKEQLSLFFTFKVRSVVKGTHYMQCSYSGQTKLVDLHENSIARKVSHKIGRTCACSLTLKYDESDPEKPFSIVYYSIHNGHALNPYSCKLPKLEREKWILEKARMGLSKKMIYTFIQASGPGNEVLKKTTRKHVQNAILKVKLEEGARHGIYHSVDIESCRLFFGRQVSSKGLFYSNLGSVDNLRDAVIVIADERQLEFIKNFGEKAILIDSTFGVASNKYNLKLTPIMVIDKFGSGVCGCYIISRKLDKSIFEQCFEELKNILGYQLVPKVFMTDDDMAYYNAWRKVMGEPHKKLLCTWHVGRAWKKNLGAKGCSHVESFQMMHQLILLKNNSDVNKFKNKYTYLIRKWSRGSMGQRQFCKYFQTFYGKRKRQWATCYRKGAGLSTNNYLESFFGNLKTNILEGKHNLRVDELIHQLLIKSHGDWLDFKRKDSTGVGYKESATVKTHNIARDFPSEYFKEVDSGWIFIRDEFINKRKASNNKTGSQVKAVVSPKGTPKGVIKPKNTSIAKKIKIKSEYVKKLAIIMGPSDFVNTVRRGEDCVNCVCLKKCRNCKACYKRFLCDCNDYLVNLDICKHIHKVCMTKDMLNELGHVAPGRPWEKSSAPSFESILNNGVLDTEEKIAKESELLCGLIKNNVLRQPEGLSLSKIKILSRCLQQLNNVDGTIVKQVPNQHPPKHQLRYQN